MRIAGATRTVAGVCSGVDLHHVGQMPDGGRYASAHVAFGVEDLPAAMAEAERLGLSVPGDPPEDGLGPYRRAFVAPEGNVGIPFEFVGRPDYPRKRSAVSRNRSS